MTEPAIPTCGTPHYDFPETLCDEPSAHRGAHIARLIINGRYCGGVAWGPDEGTAPPTPGRTETGATIPNAQANEGEPADAPADTQSTEHVYLSTGCLHGEHSYCQGKTGQTGAKKPARCKFCGTPCVCQCHAKEAT